MADPKREQVHNPQTDHGVDAQSYRYGPKNVEVQTLNRDRDLSGMRGYPSDAEYMKTVADSNIERDQAQMSDMGRRAAATTASPSSFKTGGTVQKTGLAMVHEGEVVIPKQAAVSGIMRNLPLPSRVVPDADALAAKGYTGANAPWRQ
jgi:hypothetical protein